MAAPLHARLAALVCLLLVTGCLHLGTQQRDDPDRGAANRLEAPPEPPPAPPPPIRAASHEPAYRICERSLRGHRAYVVRVELDAVKPLLVFAGGRSHPGRVPEAFDRLRQRAGWAVISSGTFFGERSHATMGTLISKGKPCQVENWDHRGTALEIDGNGVARLRTLKIERCKPHGAFYLQAGPRLVRNGAIWLHPRYEGFQDPALFSNARRVAIGLAHQGRVMLVVAFPSEISLVTEAQAMRDLGCRDAMNLDGGSSAALAIGDRVLVEPTAPLTHVVVLQPSR